MEDSFYRHFGAVSCLILIIGLSLVVKLWPQGLDKTFSKHIAAHRTGIIYYVSLFSIALPLLLLFFVRWFIPHFGFSAWFTSLIVVSATAQILCTLVPETGGRKTKIHKILALISAQLLPPLVFLISVSNTVSSVANVVAALSFTGMVGIELTLIARRSKHNYFLLLQATYFALFFIAVLTATYS